MENINEAQKVGEYRITEENPLTKMEEQNENRTVNRKLC
jgi:hypothetical protein